MFSNPIVCIYFANNSFNIAYIFAKEHNENSAYAKQVAGISDGTIANKNDRNF